LRGCFDLSGRGAAYPNLCEGDRGVNYFESEKIFKIDTPGSSYIMALVDDENFPGHVYYGKKLSGHDVSYLMRTGEPPTCLRRTTGTDCPFMIVFRLDVTKISEEDSPKIPEQISLYHKYNDLVRGNRYEIYKGIYIHTGMPGCSIL